MTYEVKLPDVFYELQSEPLFRNAVVAGGYLRDQILGIQSKDLDIFVPFHISANAVANQINEIAVKHKFEDYTGMMTNDYGKGSTIKYDFKLKGIDIDLMMVPTKVDQFGNNLIEDFPFGIQQIFSNGKKVFSSTAFDEDINRNQVTLLNVRDLKDAVKAFKKYEELNDRYLKSRRFARGLKFSTDYVLTKRTGDDWL